MDDSSVSRQAKYYKAIPVSEEAAYDSNSITDQPTYGDPAPYCDTDWKWPWWKFDLKPDAVYTTLHDRFNTRSQPILDTPDFFCDVRACAEGSRTMPRHSTPSSPSGESSGSAS
jgi:hypothetical protein